jgi:phosphohistidine phosphatase
MKLLLVQHGENVPDSVDPERPLSAKGRADVERLARDCGSVSGSVREILHSGKARARQTADILGTGLSLPVHTRAGLDPLDPVKPFASECESWSDTRIVVGHLPFLERLAALLVADREDPPVVAFQRGGMVCLEKRGPSEWCILWTLFPAQGA